MTGLELKVARIKHGVKQLQLSRVTGIHISRLSMIENGWRELREDELRRVELALGLNGNGESPEPTTIDMNSVIRRATGRGEQHGKKTD